jgi:DNA-binding response OmpR family regulator
MSSSTGSNSDAAAGSANLGRGSGESRRTIVIIHSDASARERLKELLRSADYAALPFADPAEAMNELGRAGADCLLLDATANQTAIPEIFVAVRNRPAAERIPIIFLVGEHAHDRTAALDLGADDAISQPWDDRELLARVRAQLRKREADRDLRETLRIAEEGQQIAHTAFDALAVTEKMTNDAYSLGRTLRIGVTAAFTAVIVMAIVYFAFVRSARHESRSLDAVIAQLNGAPLSRGDLMSRVRRLREKQPAAVPALPATAEAEKQANHLESQVNSEEKGSAEISSLRKQLMDTDARLRRIEQTGDGAEHVIALDEGSVCLLHVSVAFREIQSGRRLRYAGLDSQGDPLRDTGGKPILTVDGPGPEVTTDVFGTGFLAGPDGRVLTNRHVAQPWWKNDQLGNLSLQGFQPELSAIQAYFPGDPRAFNGRIRDISNATDLATLEFDLKGLKRPVLEIDSTKSAAVPGEPVILMGYATGLAAILARADESTVQKIADASGNDVSKMLGELARRNLIRPVVTQGHIGDSLPDKILFDAQTTSGGSGGPLFNERGKVIGVTYATLRDFDGSNFGIPIRLSKSLLVESEP